MSAGIPTIAGYIWASAADGFRKWRFKRYASRGRGDYRLRRLRVGRRQMRWFQLGTEKSIATESPESGAFQGAGIMPEGTKLSCRAPCCGRVDDRKCRV